MNNVTSAQPFLRVKRSWSGDRLRRRLLHGSLRLSLILVAWLVISGTNFSFGAVRALLMQGEILHDLIDEYPSAEIKNSAATSVGNVSADEEMSCSLLERYLFLHPPSGKVPAATATYSLRLPPLGRGEKLLFLFAMSLKPGWREADRKGADGVTFRVLLDGQAVFEQLWDRDGWCFCALDLSPRADKNLRLTLVCDRNRNSSADWALWGDPRVVSLSPASRPSPGAPRPNFFVFETSSGQEIATNYPALGPRGAGVIRPATTGPATRLAWFPVPIQQKEDPRLPVMKLPDDSSPTLAEVSVVSYKPRIELVSFSHSPAIVTPYESFRVTATIENAGEGELAPGSDVEVRLGLPGAFKLADRESPVKMVSKLGPGEEKNVSWRLIGPAEPGKFQFALRVGVSVLRVLDVFVSPAGKGIDYGFLGPDTGGFHEGDDSVILERGDRRLAFVRDGERFLYGTILLRREQRWEPVARLVPFAELSTRLRTGNVQKIGVQPSRHARLSTLAGEPLPEGEVAISFSDEFTDDDSVTWRFSQSFTIRDGSPWIEVATALTPEGAREAALFVAPKLLAGDGSFGESKDQALFPGLEYLGKDEPSSSTRDIHFPLSRRFTPHPLRVTIPLMAVRKGDVLLGLSWEPHQNWLDSKEMPTPLFSSPNRLPVQENHLMGLVVPSVPEFIEEGTLDTRHTLSLAAGQTLSTKASILVLCSAKDVTDAVISWIQRHRLPEIEPPRDFAEEIELCRYGFLNSVWDESAQGWSHCIGWAAGPWPGYCTLLNVDCYLSTNEEVRQTLRKRIDLVIRGCIERLGADGLWRGDACHILTGELPFLEGRLLQCATAWEQDLDRFLGSQSPDGSWRWRPLDERRASLGNFGDTTSGMCARGACRTLREAIVTGNRSHIEAAFKALRCLDTYAIPTGAQEWECPIYAPDVLAAAYAVRALVLAYEITGDDSYLEKARYWARTGIPFIYLWDRGKDMPQMRYAGIPIFGATFYRHSWLGKPVQWCALVYAYSLFQLSRYDDSLDWRQLARGITVSAMWQQYAEGKSKGCYPDSWDLIENHPNPADINPENILVNLLALNGYDPGLKHRVLNRGDNPVFVSSVAEISSADLDEKGNMNLRLKFFRGAKTYVLVAGYTLSPGTKILLNGSRLSSVEDVDTVPLGWVYLPRKRWLAVAITHSGEEDTLQIRPTSS